MTILIIHGIGGYAGVHWQSWLKKELETQGHDVLMPTMPNANRPDRKTWLRFIEKTLQDVKSEELVIVAHSLGVPTALDYIELHEGAIFGLISIAGFAEDYGAELNSYFMSEKELDINNIRPVVSHAAVIYGDDDPYVSKEALQALGRNLGVSEIVMRNGGHINSETGYTELPQIVEIIDSWTAEEN